MKVFLDDVRPAPPGWRRVHWPHEAIALLDTDEVTALSLDHDLGDDARGTGYDVILWIEEAVEARGFVPPAITVHSANTAARARMEAGIASIRRLAATRAERHAALDSQSSVALVRRVLADHASFNAVLEILERRPPDEAAAALIVEAHAADRAPAWLVAALLGRLRVAATYPLVRDLLTRGPGSLAEDYAGCAMARIAGDDARDDLLTILTGGKTRRIREGAAAGLARLADPALAPAVLAAWRARRILRDCAAGTLACLRLPAAGLLALLRSADLSERALAVRVVVELRADPRHGPVDLELTRAAHDALAADRLQFESSRRHDLLAHLAATLTA